MPENAHHSMLEKWKKMMLGSGPHPDPSQNLNRFVPTGARLVHLSRNENDRSTTCWLILLTARQTNKQRKSKHSPCAEVIKDAPILPCSLRSRCGFELPQEKVKSSPHYCVRRSTSGWTEQRRNVYGASSVKYTASVSRTKVDLSMSSR